MSKIQRANEVNRLRAIGFKLVDIARMLGCSLSTVHRDLKPEYAAAHRVEALRYKRQKALPPETKQCRICFREFVVSGRRRRDEAVLCDDPACKWFWESGAKKYSG